MAGRKFRVVVVRASTRQLRLDHREKTEKPFAHLEPEPLSFSMDDLERRLQEQTNAVKAAGVAAAPDSASEWDGSTAFAALRDEVVESSQALEKAAARFAVMCADAQGGASMVSAEAMVLSLGASVTSACDRVVAAMLDCAPRSAQNLRLAQGRAVSSCLAAALALLRAAVEGPHFLPQLAGVVIEKCEALRATPKSNKVAVKRAAMESFGAVRDTVREFEELLQEAEAAAAAAAARPSQKPEEAAADEEEAAAIAALRSGTGDGFGEDEDEDDFFDDEVAAEDIEPDDRTRLRRGARFLKFMELAVRYFVHEMNVLPAEGPGSECACAWAEGALAHSKALADQAVEVGMALYPPHDIANLLEVVREGHTVFVAAQVHLAASPSPRDDAREQREAEWAHAREEAKKQMARIAAVGTEEEGAGGGVAAAADGEVEAVVSALAGASLSAAPPPAPS